MMSQWRSIVDYNTMGHNNKYKIRNSIDNMHTNYLYQLLLGEHIILLRI